MAEDLHEGWAHTPGPWIFCGNHVEDSNGVPLVRSVRGFAQLNCADIKLIAAAPELLAACKDVLAAIAKATGEGIMIAPGCESYTVYLIRDNVSRISHDYWTGRRWSGPYTAKLYATPGEAELALEKIGRGRVEQGVLTLSVGGSDV